MLPMNPNEVRNYLREHRGLCLITIVVAACSILYELLIAQSLALLAANTVVWYSVTIGLYLFGMGIGSFLSTYLERLWDTDTLFVITELLLSVVGAMSPVIIHVLHMFFEYAYVWGYDPVGKAAFFGGAFLVTFVVGLLTGIELPVLMHMGERESGQDSISIILGLDYIGSLVGAVAFPLLLLPYLELISIGFMIGLLNAGVAVWAVMRMPSRSRLAWVPCAVGGTIVVVLLVGLGNRDPIQQYFLKKFYYYQGSATDNLSNLFALPDKSLPRVERSSSPYQKIDFVTTVLADTTDILTPAYSDKISRESDPILNRMLFLNGDFQLMSSIEEIYHEYFAHVPIIAHRKVPKRVLLLGGGDGLLARELLKHSGIEEIEHVDLDPTLVELANNHPELAQMNRYAFKQKRINTTIGDGYSYVKTTSDRYDAIYIDFPMPADYNLAKLYSREFFHFVLESLADDGYAVFDATGIGLLTSPLEGQQQELLEDNDWPIYYNTLRAAGAAEIVPFVTTLESDNQAAWSILEQTGVSLLAPALQVAIQFSQTPEHRRIVTEAAKRAAFSETIIGHIVALQQGFIMISRSPGQFGGEYQDLGIELYVLNRDRFALAFAIDFPKNRDLDPDAVNSILRPRFPTIPLWMPRVPM